MTRIYLVPRTEFLETKTVADNAIPKDQIDAINGVAPLDADAKVPSANLPPTVQQYVPNKDYWVGDLVHTGGTDIYRAEGGIPAANATPTIPTTSAGVGIGYFVKIAGGGNSVGSSQDTWISEIAGTSILLDADGSAILTPSDETIHFANIADETASRSISNPDYVHEIGIMQMSNNQWNSKSVIAGGIEWKMSAATQPASIMFRRYPNCNAPTNGLGTNWAETWTAQNATPTYNDGGSTNYDILRGGDWTTTAVTMSGTAYRRNRFTIYSRNLSEPHRWEVEIVTTGSSSLVMHVEYFGPRYDYN